MKTFIYLILMLLTMTAIFAFSTDNGKETNAKSSAIVKPIESTLKATSQKNFETEKEETDYWKKINSKITVTVRKGAHATIFCLLSIFTLLFFRSLKIEDADAIMFTILLCILYAASDEFHQNFLNGRDGKFSDVCIDTFGAWIGTMIVHIGYKLKYRRTNRKLHFKVK